MATSTSDEAFGRVLHQLGGATEEQIEAAKAIQAAKAKMGAHLSLGEVLQQQGLITPAIRENVERRVAAAQDGGIKQLGPFKLLKKLGEGGMGAVYLAEDTAVGRKVALKVLTKKHAGDSEFLTRFRREAKAAGHLNHVNIVCAHQVGEELGHHFLVMEFVEGEPLDKLLKRSGALPWEKALEIIMQAGRGLQHAHAHGIIHRDIKPGNIVVTPQGVAKILDLGLSKSVSGEETTFHTQTGVALGTPHYISPEQARGDKQIDGRSDIYSLGATFYHLVTGSTPFHSSTAAGVILKHLNAQLPNPQDVNPDIPDSVVHVIMRMMAKEPADRYANCKELLDDLELVIDGKRPSSRAIEENRSSIAMPLISRPRGPAAARAPLPHPGPRGAQQRRLAGPLFDSFTNLARSPGKRALMYAGAAACLVVALLLIGLAVHANRGREQQAAARVLEEKRKAEKEAARLAEEKQKSEDLWLKNEAARLENERRKLADERRKVDEELKKAKPAPGVPAAAAASQTPAAPGTALAPVEKPETQNPQFTQNTKAETAQTEPQAAQAPAVPVAQAASLRESAADSLKPTPLVEGAAVWLCDLPATEVSVGYGWLGKAGALGYDEGDGRIRVASVESPHGVSMHPPQNGQAHVAYQIDGRFDLFRASVAINDTGEGCETPMVFKVIGDSKVRWQSTALSTPGQPQDCSVDVQGVAKLELVVDCPGNNKFTHAVWIEPLLVSQTRRVAAARLQARLQYEAEIAKAYSFLEMNNLKAALAWLGQAKADPALAAMRAELDLDIECCSCLEELSKPVAAGAVLLADGRALTLKRSDGKELPIGKGTKNTFSALKDGTILIDQDVGGGAKATAKWPLAELALQTRYQFARWGMPPGLESEFNLAFAGLVIFSRAAPEDAAIQRIAAQAEEVRGHLEAARKGGFQEAKIVHLLRRLEVCERENQAALAAKTAETLLNQKKWDEAKAAIERLRKNFPATLTAARSLSGLEQKWRQGALLAGLWARSYALESDALADSLNDAAFRALGTRTVEDLGIDSADTLARLFGRREQIGIRFLGYLAVPQDGTYTFFCESDDGSMLYIGGTIVVSNDGGHPAVARSGSISLKAGRWPFRLNYCQYKVDAVLAVNWSGPGIAQQAIPPAAFWRLAREADQFAEAQGGERAGGVMPGLERASEAAKEAPRSAPQAALPALLSPVPNAAAQKEAEKAIKDLFKAEYAKPAPADKLALAQKFLRQGVPTASDLNSKYVMLREARDLAAQAGDADCAFNAVKEMAKAFAINDLDEKAAVLAKTEAAVPGPNAARALAERYLELADQAIAADKYDLAWQSATKAGATARNGQDSSLATRAGEKLKVVQDIQREAGNVAAAVKTLEKNPDDPAANATVGKFLVFFKGDCNKGLAMLAKSSDAALKPLAEKELAQPRDGNAQAALGDLYWDLAERQTGALKAAFRARAVKWYRTGATTAAEAIKTKAYARIDVYEQALNAGNPRFINLLPLVDVKRDPVDGTWRVENGSLVCGKKAFSRAELPYTPPEEFDFLIVFTRLDGEGDVGQLVHHPAGKKLHYWMSNGRDFGFDTVEGRNDVRVSREPLINGRRYWSLLQVRRDGIRAFLDGELVIDHKTDYTDMGYHSYGWLRHDALGVVAQEPAMFHRAEVIEVTGKGRRLR